MPALSRRSLLLGATATAATGCAEIGFPAAPVVSDARFFEKESLVGGDQANCSPSGGAPRDLGWAPRMMRVSEAWSYSLEKKRLAYGKDIVIGHIDTGVANHVELLPETGQKNPILWDRGYDFVDDRHGGYDPLVDTRYLEQIGHGTATASVMVSRGNLGPAPTADYTCGGTTGPGRITGTAPGAYLLPVRAFRLAATIEHARVATAIKFLVDQKVDVITMALGWPFDSQDIEQAIAQAVDANIIVLAAAGNFIDTITYPAKGKYAIGVAGVDPDMAPWRFSSHGEKVVISAPGDKVWRAYRDEKTNRLDLISPRFGTSFAVSLTAGVAALWLAHHGRASLIAGLRPGATLQDVFRDALQATACAPPKWEDQHRQFGAGLVDANALLRIDPFNLPKKPYVSAPCRIPGSKSTEAD